MLLSRGLGVVRRVDCPMSPFRFFLNERAYLLQRHRQILLLRSRRLWVRATPGAFFQLLLPVALI